MTQENDRPDLKSPAKDDTNPFGRLAYIPKSKFRRRAIVLAMAVVAGIGMILIFRASSPDHKPVHFPAKASKKSNPPRPIPRINDRLTVQLQVDEIAATETVARQDKKQLVELLGQMMEKNGLDARDWDFSNFTVGQINLLQQKAASGDATASGFLVQLGKYRSLKNRIRALETHLGNPELVASGDTHFQIASDFLIARAGKTAAEARQILQDIQFQEPLLPGFKVWNFWLADGFCTFVTQGTALLTPEEAALQKNEMALNRLNSVFYIIGSYDDLQERKILIGGFLKSTRLGEIDPGQFPQAIDLRSQQLLHVSAAALQLKKISRLEIFPREFSSGRDYAVNFEPNGRWAQIAILNKDAFRGRRIVIAVE